MEQPDTAAQSGQLAACEAIMARHRDAMEALREGRRAKTTPLSGRRASDLARQIEDLKTATEST